MGYAIDVEPAPEHAVKFVAVPVVFAVATSGRQVVAFAVGVEMRFVEVSGPL